MKQMTEPSEIRMSHQSNRPDFSVGAATRAESDSLLHKTAFEMELLVKVSVFLLLWVVLLQEYAEGSRVSIFIFVLEGKQDSATDPWHAELFPL